MSELEEHGFSFEQMRKDLQIRDTDLDSCMSEQASLYGYYAMMYAKAQLEADRSKSQVELVKAKKYAMLRTAKTGRGVKFTEAQLEAEVLRTEDVINANEQANLSRMRATMIKEALEAFRQRRDMLVQIGKSRLEERKGELYLKSGEVDRDSRKEKVRQLLEKGK